MPNIINMLMVNIKNPKKLVIWITLGIVLLLITIVCGLIVMNTSQNLSEGG